MSDIISGIAQAASSASETVQKTLGLKKVDAAAQSVMPDVASSSAPSALGLPSESAGQTVTGGRRHKKTRKGKRSTRRTTRRKVRRGGVDNPLNVLKDKGSGTGLKGGRRTRKH